MALLLTPAGLLLLAHSSLVDRLGGLAALAFRRPKKGLIGPNGAQ